MNGQVSLKKRKGSQKQNMDSEHSHGRAAGLVGWIWHLRKGCGGAHVVLYTCASNYLPCHLMAPGGKAPNAWTSKDDGYEGVMRFWTDESGCIWMLDEYYFL